MSHPIFCIQYDVLSTMIKSMIITKCSYASYLRLHIFNFHLAQPGDPQWATAKMTDRWLKVYNFAANSPFFSPRKKDCQEQDGLDRQADGQTGVVTMSTGSQQGANYGTNQQLAELQNVRKSWKYTTAGGFYTRTESKKGGRETNKHTNKRQNNKQTHLNSIHLTHNSKQLLSHDSGYLHA